MIKLSTEKGCGEDHEEGESCALSGPTGGEGHEGGMSDERVWSGGHGAWCFHRQGTLYGGRSGHAMRKFMLRCVIWIWMGKSRENEVRCISGCMRKRKGG